MPELRWVLLTLGALLIVVLYLWGRGTFRRPRSGGRDAPHAVEPTFSAGDAPLEPRGWTPPPTSRFDAPSEFEPAPDREPAFEADLETEAEPEPEPDPEPASVHEVDRIVTVRFVPRDELNGQEAVLALRAAGLRHGRYGIFHRYNEQHPNEFDFSVANLTEPGSFDLTRLAETVIPGMSFFLVLPGVGDPVERFDLMVHTARELAHDLGADLHDEKGSSWSIQRERYVREELIEYRHQHKLRA